ncbi:MAG: hypothetical protein A2Y66_01765 [Nitrospirae bacterium RBG_13_41_22]|nr:MAG: hypothetical protein A2Y66_01765 [Nitrospirae bacterium RBG_13_41_22]
MPGIMNNDMMYWYEMGRKAAGADQPQQQQGQQQQGGLMNVDPSTIKGFFQPTGAAQSAGPAGNGGTSGLSPVGAGGNSGGTMGGGGSGGGMGAMGIGAVIAAAIAAQHVMSHNTDTEFEGQKTKDAFSGNFGTEPWFAFAADKLNWEPTEGEKFDAAIKNDDWSLAAKRFPSMMNYWANPAQQWLTKPAREYIGKDIDMAIDPASYVTRKIEKWF